MPASFSRAFLLSLAGSLLVSGAVFAAAPAPAPAKTGAAPAQQPALDEHVAPIAVTIEYGKADAPITIEEFASLSCSHCAEFSKSVYPEIKKKYIDTGKAHLITHSYIRNEPDMRGTMLLHCLKSNEERQQFAKVLFEMQDQWAFAENVTDALGDIAKVGGMSQQEYMACVKDAKLETGLLKDLQTLSETRDIQGTPTFYLNGNKHTGAFDINTLSKAIDSTGPKKASKESGGKDAENENPAKSSAK